MQKRSQQIAVAHRRLGHQLPSVGSSASGHNIWGSAINCPRVSHQPLSVEHRLPLVRHQPPSHTLVAHSVGWRGAAVRQPPVAIPYPPSGTRQPKGRLPVPGACKPMSKFSDSDGSAPFCIGTPDALTTPELHRRSSSLPRHLGRLRVGCVLRGVPRDTALGLRRLLPGCRIAVRSITRRMVRLCGWLLLWLRGIMCILLLVLRSLCLMLLLLLLWLLILLLLLLQLLILLLLLLLLLLWLLILLTLLWLLILLLLLWLLVLLLLLWLLILLLLLWLLILLLLLLWLLILLLLLWLLVLLLLLLLLWLLILLLLLWLSVLQRWRLLILRWLLVLRLLRLLWLLVLLLLARCLVILRLLIWLLLLLR